EQVKEPPDRRSDDGNRLLLRPRLHLREHRIPRRQLGVEPALHFRMGDVEAGRRIEAGHGGKDHSRIALTIRSAYRNKGMGLSGRRILFVLPTAHFGEAELYQTWQLLA